MINSSTNFDDNELITKSQVASEFLHMATRTFERKRQKLHTQGFPQPDKRMGNINTLRWRVGDIRTWVAGNSNFKHTDPTFNPEPINHASSADEIISSFGNP